MRHVILAISILLSVSGLASIVDGFYRWGLFFTDLIDIYRYWATFLFLPLEDLLRWMGLSFPDWVRDVIVVWCALGGVGARGYFYIGQHFFSWLDRPLDQGIKEITITFLLLPPAIILVPLLFLINHVFVQAEKLIRGQEYPSFHLFISELEVFKYFIWVVLIGFGPLILAMFIDWQFLNH